MVAWETEWNGVRSIVSAESRTLAKSKTVKSACGAGYNCKYTEIKVKRIPKYDGWAAIDSSGACWGEAFLPKG